jgi:hypothetical protein
MEGLLKRCHMRGLHARQSTGQVSAQPVVKACPTALLGEAPVSCDSPSMGKHAPHEIQERLQCAAAARNAAETDCGCGKADAGAQDQGDDRLGIVDRGYLTEPTASPSSVMRLRRARWEARARRSAGT